MDLLIHQGGQAFLQLEPELADGTVVSFNGAAAEAVADPTVCTVTANPDDASQIAVSAVGDNIGSTTVTITYTNPDGKTATLVINVTVAPADAAALDAKQLGDEVPAGTPFPAPVPTVTGLSPAAGSVAGGDTVTISGTGLKGATAVNFGTTPAASFSIVDGKTVTAVTPPFAAAGAVDVTVTTPGGTSAVSAADQFTAS